MGLLECKAIDNSMEVNVKLGETGDSLFVVKVDISIWLANWFISLTSG
jgi:hypothetical protein